MSAPSRRAARGQRSAPAGPWGKGIRRSAPSPTVAREALFLTHACRKDTEAPMLVPPPAGSPRILHQRVPLNHAALRRPRQLPFSDSHDPLLLRRPCSRVVPRLGWTGLPGPVCPPSLHGEDRANPAEVVREQDQKSAPRRARSRSHLRIRLEVVRPTQAVGIPHKPAGSPADLESSLACQLLSQVHARC
jgi:hypothetical protein